MVEAQAQFNNGDPITCEYIRGARIEDCFKNPRRKKAIVIGCSEYANLRKLTGKNGYGDINEALEDIKIVRQGLKRLRFKKKDIKMLINPSYEELRIELD